MPSDQISSIMQYLQIAPHQVPQDKESQRPILKHHDMQPGNIFVADDFSITGVIDWQHCSVLPLILQAGVPEYLQNFSDEQLHSLKMPPLPKDFSDMDAATQAAEMEIYRRRHLHFYYFVATYKFNRSHYNTLLLDSTLLIQTLLRYASTPWEGDNISLKAALVEAVDVWSSLTAIEQGEIPQCPISFSDEERAKVLALLTKKNSLDSGMEYVRDRLHISSTGWTSHENYEYSRAENVIVKRETVDASDDDTKEAIMEHWPYDDHPDT